MPIWLILVFNRLKEISFSKKIVVYLLFFYSVSGIFYQAKYIYSQQDNQHWLLIKWLKQCLPFATNGQIAIADKNPAVYLSLNDELQYFYPHLQAKLVDSDFEKNCEFKEKFLLIDETYSCKDFLLQDNQELQHKKLKVLGVYRRENENFYLLGK